MNAHRYVRAFERTDPRFMAYTAWPLAAPKSSNMTACVVSHLAVSCPAVMRTEVGITNQLWLFRGTITPRCRRYM
jgi:hypothetical protein